MPTMPRFMLQVCAALACAGLLFASGMAGAADACSESYKVCNGGCDRRANDNGGGLCRIQCDYRLIACDRQSAAASLRQGSRYSVARPSQR
jgi:hypothetical protein